MSNPESTRYEIDKDTDVAIREMYKPNKKHKDIKPCTVDENGCVVDYIYMNHMYSTYINEYENENSENVELNLNKKPTEELNLDNIKELSIKEYNYEHEDHLKNINIDLKSISDAVYEKPEVYLSE